MSEWAGPVADADADVAILASTPRFRGGIWDVRSDELDFADQRVVRDLVVHPGAVGVVALDEDDRVLLVRQYRHPVGRYLFEPPAGLLDKPGEDPLLAAQRELAEEAGFTADEWHLLVDFANSPGGSSECFRCFLARGLRRLDGGRPATGEAEEVDLPRAWVSLDEARDLVLAGQLQNPTTVVGVLAAWSSRATGWDTLRPTDSPWPIRERVVSTGRTRRVDRT
ncbi:MAG: NUDIX hydrolase [Actinobacteria bacterium]|nr:NUDIX hydrolase [Actinomycetota bacterium]